MSFVDELNLSVTTFEYRYALEHVAVRNGLLFRMYFLFDLNRCAESQRYSENYCTKQTKLLHFHRQKHCWNWRNHKKHTEFGWSKSDTLPAFGRFIDYWLLALRSTRFTLQLYNGNRFWSFLIHKHTETDENIYLNAILITAAVFVCNGKLHIRLDAN